MLFRLPHPLPLTLPQYHLKSPSSRHAVGMRGKSILVLFARLTRMGWCTACCQCRCSLAQIGVTDQKKRLCYAAPQPRYCPAMCSGLVPSPRVSTRIRPLARPCGCRGLAAKQHCPSTRCWWVSELLLQIWMGREGGAELPPVASPPLSPHITFSP